MAKDQIYSVPLTHVGGFEFDDAVADVFPDMILRSVPGYASMLSMIAQCADRFAATGTNVYDLGCSLGAGTVLINENAPHDCNIVAVDNSQAMVSRLADRISELPQSGRIDIRLADVRDTEIENASLVVLNLTLQFLPVAERTNLIERAAAGMIPGGALLLSEKVCFEDPAQQKLMTSLHHDFKRAHGYSDLEIAQKRTAIEDMLVPETIDAHAKRLRTAGFTTVSPWLQCFNFASIVAVKE